MITKRDKEIIKHIEKYGFITNIQCKEIFMDPASSKAYEVARRRLKMIQECNVTFGSQDYPLSMRKNMYSNENVFYVKRFPSYHDLQIMNVYSRLLYLGVEVPFFKKSATWKVSNQRSDGFFTCKYNDTLHAFLLEVCVSNNDAHLKQYEALHASGELQSKLNGTFPRIVVVGHKGNKPKTDLNVRYVDEDLSNIMNIFN